MLYRLRKMSTIESLFYLKQPAAVQEPYATLTDRWHVPHPVTPFKTPQNGCGIPRMEVCLFYSCSILNVYECCLQMIISFIHEWSCIICCCCYVHKGINSGEYCIFMHECASECDLCELLRTTVDYVVKLFFLRTVVLFSSMFMFSTDFHSLKGIANAFN